MYGLPQFLVVMMPMLKSESVSYSVMSNSLQPHGLQPTRLLRPWNAPGKNTYAQSHFKITNLSLSYSCFQFYPTANNKISSHFVSKEENKPLAIRLFLAKSYKQNYICNFHISPQKHSSFEYVKCSCSFIKFSKNYCPECKHLFQ